MSSFSMAAYVDLGVVSSACREAPKKPPKQACTCPRGMLRIGAMPWLASHAPNGRADARFHDSFP